MTNMDPQQFSKAINEAGVIILDVRTQAEFIEGHIENAQNIDINSETFDSEISLLDSGAMYAVYCRSGRRSLAAIDTMQNLGFTKFSHLENGILDWQENGLPLVVGE
ncbi:MAG: rhodanese-like domain-containing protein [Actinobacteria bacterium]|jgi:rhodanese-related sulfurtransferase|uniref:Unannotated protein n=1 Tax=freshwater metagenome TaxID=449393 RepID=A0A6J7NHC2_9ZZZZ|nr:rhodanese-like domain-containing protein [Actinomycetota bacterium]MSW09139.1 rhodanese-like domain-containing protein [Actinomycetota bacterium]